MKSRSSGAVDGNAYWTLADRLLLRIAGELGPRLDRIDVDADLGGLRVRELLFEFVRDGGPWPTEVRVALLDLAERGLLQLSERPNILDPEGEVYLSLRGLVAARRLVPGHGRPRSCVSLSMRKNALFDARFETGNKELDRRLNAAGLALAAFYVLAVKQPSRDQPLLLLDCGPAFVRLALHGIGVKSGPGTRLVPSSDSIVGAFERLRLVLRLKETSWREDKRQRGWYLDGPFPEVRIVGATGPQFTNWTEMKANLANLLHGRGFPDRRHDQVAVHSDQEVQGLMDEKRNGRSDEDGHAAGVTAGGAAASVADASGD